MSCYTPMDAFYFQGSLKFISKGDYSESPNIQIPCGKCLGCRMDRCSDWALRCWHEGLKYENNCFITLTFRDNPVTCDVVWFQEFISRLRAHCKRHGLPSPRYFHSTEYGTKKMRPHHHAILFNYLPDDLELFKFRRSGNWYTSKTLEKLWGHGFVTIGELTHDSAAYVAAYTVKKDNRFIYYHSESGITLLPEKMTCSRNPAIGLSHFINHYNSFCNQEFAINSKGKKQRLPRAYLKWLEEKYPELYCDLKIKREARAFERSLINSKNQDEKELSRLKAYQKHQRVQDKYNKSLDKSFTPPTFETILQFSRNLIQTGEIYETLFDS